tara:strand:- start:301 stop:417 length:117 start_codon:yes stop_codon:yes gene_type:complete
MGWQARKQMIALTGAEAGQGRKIAMEKWKCVRHRLKLA